jgi:hypothetical protein
MSNNNPMINGMAQAHGNTQDAAYMMKNPSGINPVQV